MKSKKGQPDFFISHSKETKYKIAIPLLQFLTSIGFDVWLDRKEILVGEYIYTKIEDAIKMSKYCIAIIDITYLERSWTMKELQLFHKRKDCIILPIFVNVEKNIVYNKIPWLEGIAFEKITTKIPDSNTCMNIFCRIVSRYYGNTITDTLECCYESLAKYDFPCKETLTSLIHIKDYYSCDFRLAIISLCNISSIIYAIYTAISNQSNKSMDIMFQFNNTLRDYCFSVENKPDYNMYIGSYNYVLASIKELENLLQRNSVNNFSE